LDSKQESAGRGSRLAALVAWTWRLLDRRETGWLALGVASLGLVSFGLAGVGRPAGFLGSNLDVRYSYAAAKCWSRGVSPYDAEVFQEVVREHGLGRKLSDFAYPPHSAPLGFLLAVSTITVGKVLMSLLNLACVACLAITAVRTYRSRCRDPGPLRATDLWLAAIVVGNPFTAHVLWTGNPSLIAVTSLVVGWTLARRERWLVGGVLLGLATWKPQLALLPMIWLVLERRGRALAAAAVTGVLCVLIPLRVSNPIELLSGWIDAIGRYETADVNYLGFEYVLGLRSFVSAFGPVVPDLTILAVIGGCLLWFFRHRLPSRDWLGLLVGLELVLIYAHDYDLVVLVPLLVSVWGYAAREPRLRGPALALLVLLCFPLREVRKLDVPLLLHWRTPLVVIAVGGLLWLGLRANRRKEPGGSATTAPRE